MVACSLSRNPMAFWLIFTQFTTQLLHSYANCDDYFLLWAVIKHQFKSRPLTLFKHFGTKSIKFLYGIKYRGLQYINTKINAIKNNIESQTIDIEFKNGETYEGIDTVLCCTGYKTNKFTFLKGIFENRKEKDGDIKNLLNPRKMYKHMIIPEFGSDFAFNGLNRPSIGSLIPISEIAARFYAEIISGYKPLPSMADMENEIDYKYKDIQKVFPSHYDTIPSLVEHHQTMDDFAEFIGCDINEWHLFTYHPYLWWKVGNGTIRSMHYRIYGRHRFEVDYVEMMLKRNNTQKFADSWVTFVIVTSIHALGGLVSFCCKCCK